MLQQKLYAVILAGGIGSRFENTIPKQFSIVAGKPLLMHTINVFYNCPLDLKIILVLNKEHIETWNKITEHHNFKIPHTVVLGGKERFHSAKNAFNTIPENEEALIAIHDGVRPFVSKEVIMEAYTKAKEYNAAIPIISTVDPIRLFKDGHSEPLDLTYDRSNIHIVQTPQVFKYKILKSAFSQDYNNTFRDESIPVEKIGQKTHMIQGNRENIKITFPIDLVISEALYPIMFDKQ